MSQHPAAHLLAASTIEVGKHYQVHVGPLVVNLDTIWATAAAMIAVLAMGFYLRSKATSGVPGKLQLFWEVVTNWVQEQVDANVGPTAPYVVPIGVTLFIFILVANWIELIPSAEAFPSPNSDINLPAAMALAVVVWANIVAFKRQGFRRYYARFAHPYKIMFPLELLMECIKPVTLSLRLWGNMFAGGLMISLIALLPLYFGWPVAQAGWKLFDAGIGLIQAFIFALLTILYFGMALSGHDEGEAHDLNEDLAATGGAHMP